MSDTPDDPILKMDTIAKDYCGNCNCGICMSLRDEMGRSCSGCNWHHEERTKLQREIAASRAENERILCDWGVAKRELAASREEVSYWKNRWATEVDYLKNENGRLEKEIKYENAREVNGHIEQLESEVERLTGDISLLRIKHDGAVQALSGGKFNTLAAAVTALLNGFHWNRYGTVTIEELHILADKVREAMGK